MNPATILTTILGVIDAAKQAINLGEDAAPFISALYDQLSGKTVDEITQADLDTLEAKVDALSDELQSPLPPETA